MKAPPLLLACAALFWGWQTGHWVTAVIAGALLEAPRVVARRWSFAPAEMNRIADFCLLLVAGLGVYFYFSFGNPRAITLLFQWLPVALLPVGLALLWSSAATVPLSVLFIGLRRQSRNSARSLDIDIGYPFLGLWLLAASAANHRDSGFYWGAVALLAWPLWLHRPRSFAPAAWAAMLVAAVAFGHAGHVGLNLLQTWLEGAAPEWLSNSGSRTDPYRSTTDMGSIGALKESEDIVLRLEAPAGQKTPLLLHRASYDSYFTGAWAARNGRFTAIDAASASSPASGADPPLVRHYVVHEFAPGGNPVLSLPDSLLRIGGISAALLRRNPLGAVQAELPPGYVNYALEAGDRGTLADASPPGANDLALPAAEAALLHDIVRSAGLADRTPAALAQALKDYFSAGYTYSTFQEKAGTEHTPLARFLLTSHAGHCEYFATATVLLARAAGVPARYATGFSVQEYSRLEQAYLARERHAHAWAQLYVDGRWLDLDTTPPTWIAIEEARAPPWRPLYDALSWARFRLAEELAGNSNVALFGAAIALALVAITWLIKRKARKSSAGRDAAGSRAAQAPVQPGRDSEFYAVERRLAELGLRRGGAEPLLAWLASLHGEAKIDIDTLIALARLHYRLRFDPQGLAPGERAALRETAQQWLARHPLANP